MDDKSGGEVSEADEVKAINDITKRVTTSLDDLLSEVIADENKESQAISRLEKELQHEKDGRKEDRFVFLIVLMIFMDIILLKDSANIALPLVVLILELVTLLLLAKRMGSEEIAKLIDNIISRFLRGKPPSIDGE